MKKLLVFGMSFVLLGAGCTFFQSGTEGDVVGGGEATVGVPPAIELVVEGDNVAGVEGSYCYGPTCVDKIAPPDLVTETGLDFTTITRTGLTFSVDAEIAEMSVSVMDESGEFVSSASAELEEDASGNFVYHAPSTLAAGDYYLIVFAQFEEGGDVSYVFPVHFE